MRQPRLLWSVGVLGCVLFAPGCNEDLVERVPSDVCASGLRWAGELTPNPEMYPGHDCVGCHKEYDGPELMAAGTIYGVVDPDGARTTRNDCFGLEGVRVTITAADGHVLQTRTNRAGNFFFEGPESSLAKPFNVVIDYDLGAAGQSREPMATSPSYGGCARCHNPEARPTPDAGPGRVLGEDEVARGVYPIYTGPVLP